MDSIEGLTSSIKLPEFKVDVAPLRNQVRFEFGHLQSLNSSEDPVQRVQGMVIGLGKSQEQMRNRIAQGEEISPLEKMGLRLNETITRFAAKGSGWDEAEFDLSLSRGETYARHEKELIDATGETAFEVWAKHNIVSKVASTD